MRQPLTISTFDRGSYRSAMNVRKGMIKTGIPLFRSFSSASIQTRRIHDLGTKASRTNVRTIGAGQTSIRNFIPAWMFEVFPKQIRQTIRFQASTHVCRRSRRNVRALLDFVARRRTLFNLVQQGIVEPRDAYIKAVDKTNFESMLTRGGFKL